MKRLAFAVLCLAVCAPCLRAQSAEERKATVTYLRELQAADGGFLPAAPDPAGTRLTKSSLRSTSSALRALKYFHGEPRDSRAVAAFVEKCFDKSTGGFADVPGGKPDVVTTAIGIMAVVEVKRPTEPYADGVLTYLGSNVKGFEDIRIAAAGLEALGKKAEQADAWLKDVAKLRHEDGTYGTGNGAARDTGGAVVAVLRLGGEVPHEDNVVKTIKSGQRDDGGWGKADAKGSDLESSYRVMRCLHMLKERPADVDKLKAFIAKCRNKDGGYGTAPGQESGAGGTYFAAIILHWLEEK
ncbi:MAG TPA: prenyltransferase/squalene oxidase repeat-containing protein [Gemmataceae bacterium]|nr:prenyltransferase/squalene oxidase repeat-containing protein [Gemmataceae bacterium]